MKAQYSPPSGSAITVQVRPSAAGKIMSDLSTTAQYWALSTGRIMGGLRDFGGVDQPCVYVGCEEERVYEVKDWVEVHRLFHREGLSKMRIAEVLAMSRNTVARWLELSEPPRYERRPAGSILDPYRGRS